jgi:hypothetical protein
MWRRAHDEKWAAWRNTWRAEHRDELRAYRHAYYLARKQGHATSPDAPVQMAVVER